MRRIVLWLLILLLVLPVVSAIENNQYFTIDPNETVKCISINLPQDLGISLVNETKQAIIEAESSWLRISYNKVTIHPGVINKNPLCFYPPSSEEGQHTFYRIKVYSPDLDLMNDVKGGFCVSRYEDVDSGVEADETTNICRMMGSNSDIFDIQFKEDISFVKPGERLSKTIYVTSYANTSINLRLVTNLQTDFSSETITTSSEHPTSMKRFKVLIPEGEGNYTIKVIGEIVGCQSEFCRKEAETIIKVRENYTRSGFSASVIPRNINIKKTQSADFRVLVTNYDADKEFRIGVTSDPSIPVSPSNTSVMIGEEEEKTIRFTSTIGSEEKGLYKIYFNIKTEDGERLLTAYLSVGEFLSDSLRDIDNINENSNQNTRNEIENAFNQWKNSYNNSGYGDDIDEYEKFRNEIKNAQGDGGNGGDNNGNTSGNTGGNNNYTPSPSSGGFDWTLVIIPIIIAVVVVVFFIYKKSHVTEDDGYAESYSGFQ